MLDATHLVSSASSVSMLNTSTPQCDKRRMGSPGELTAEAERRCLSRRRRVIIALYPLGAPRELDSGSRCEVSADIALCPPVCSNPSIVPFICGGLNRVSELGVPPSYSKGHPYINMVRCRSF
jgi:hypothetical protein